MDDAQNPTPAQPVTPAADTPPAAPPVEIPAAPVQPVTPVEPTPPPSQSTPPVAPADSGSGAKSSVNILGVVAILVMVGAMAAGAVWFMGNNRTSQYGQADQQESVPAPTTAAEQSIEGELNAIEIESNDKEFTTVDTDINSL